MSVDASGAPASGGTAPAVQTHWVAESGALDVFVLLGPSAKAVGRQYATLTGGTQLPPLFALGYHQRRWNYNDQDDILALDKQFEELDFLCARRGVRPSAVAARGARHGRLPPHPASTALRAFACGALSSHRPFHARQLLPPCT